MQTVPITLRNHLIPFFFNESDGEVCKYGKLTVKAVLFSPKVSSIGRIIRLLMEKSGKPLNIQNFNLCITVTDIGDSKKYKGEFYKIADGRNSFLMLPKQANEDINDMLEDIFRMSFYNYVQGYLEAAQNESIVYIIDQFINKYDLLEFGFSNDTLRRQYYREKNKSKIVARFQNKRFSPTSKKD